MVRHFSARVETLELEEPFMKEIPSSILNLLPPEQINLIELNLELTFEERILQLQSAVDLIEEMRNSMKESNKN